MGWFIVLWSLAGLEFGVVEVDEEELEVAPGATFGVCIGYADKMLEESDLEKFYFEFPGLDSWLSKYRDTKLGSVIYGIRASNSIYADGPVEERASRSYNSFEDVLLEMIAPEDRCNGLMSEMMMERLYARWDSDPVAAQWIESNELRVDCRGDPRKIVWFEVLLGEKIYPDCPR